MFIPFTLLYGLVAFTFLWYMLFKMSKQFRNILIVTNTIYFVIFLYILQIFAELAENNKFNIYSHWTTWSLILIITLSIIQSLYLYSRNIKIIN
jgi:hypothetical protein